MMSEQKYSISQEEKERIELEHSVKIVFEEGEITKVYLAPREHYHLTPIADALAKAGIKHDIWWIGAGSPGVPIVVADLQIKPNDDRRQQ